MLTTYCRLFSTKQGVLDDGRSCFTHNNSFSYLRIYITNMLNIHPNHHNQCWVRKRWRCSVFFSLLFLITKTTKTVTKICALSFFSSSHFINVHFFLKFFPKSWLLRKFVAPRSPPWQPKQQTESTATAFYFFIAHFVSPISVMDQLQTPPTRHLASSSVCKLLYILIIPEQYLGLKRCCIWLCHTVGLPAQPVSLPRDKQCA